VSQSGSASFKDSPYRPLTLGVSTGSRDENDVIGVE
jgi:hypothetical protein